MRAIACLSVAVIVAYFPIFLGQIVYKRDLIRWVYPARSFVRECISRGEWPLWNSKIGLGFSVLTDPLYGIFYPPNLLHQLGPLANSVTLGIFLHLLAGAIGAMLLAKLFDLPTIAALVAGLGWGLSGYTASLWTLGILLQASALVPWIAVGFVYLAHRQSLHLASARAIALLSFAVAGSLLLGEFFVTFMGVLCGASLAVVWNLGSHWGQTKLVPQRRRWSTLFLGGLAGVLLGISIAAVAIIPAVLGLPSTQRSQPFPLNIALNWSLHPARTLGFIAGDFWGRAWENNPTVGWARTILDSRPLSTNIYLGASLVALALTGLRWPRRKPSRAAARTTWWSLGTLVIGILFLLLALGRHTPLFNWVRIVLPPFSYMRSPEKFLIPLLPIVTLLAGFGTKRLFFENGPIPWLRILVMTILLGSLAFLAPWFFGSELGEFVRKGAIHGCVATTAVLVVVFLSCHYPFLRYLIVMVVSLDLTYGIFNLLKYAGPSLISEVPILAAEIPNRGASTVRTIPRLFLGSAVEDSVIRASRGTEEWLVMRMLLTNIGTMHGLANIPGYETALPPEQEDLLALKRRDVLRLASIDYALLSVQSPDVPEDLTLMSEKVAGVRLYQVKNILPRAYLSFASSTGQKQEIAPHVLNPDVVSGRRVWLESSNLQELRSNGSPPKPCILERVETIKLRFKCSADRPAFAVFVEQFAPGWRATVDGQFAAVVRANTFMRAVPVPAGNHIIEMTFWPPGLTMGMLISILGLAIATVLSIQKQKTSMQKDIPTGNES